MIGAHHVTSHRTSIADNRRTQPTPSGVTAVGVCRRAPLRLKRTRAPTPFRGKRGGAEAGEVPRLELLRGGSWRRHRARASWSSTAPPMMVAPTKLQWRSGHHYGQTVLVLRWRVSFSGLRHGFLW